ncbi:hypothetical protein [Sphingomonas echinoides]|uniref:Uncharacterized protein n=1 Tax=Sphingomonas echinoides TaxID=59803 RepID=A0ABU4PNI0_9SPHN|nr:hypothetical protein [Sphingomonas echinoides]MDX5984683.1 hypothetical protein [Sphingomonas echinoides]
MFDPSHWAWPQWTMAIMLFLWLLVSASSHGKPREPYNGFTAIVRFALSVFLLSYGGFFK